MEAPATARDPSSASPTTTDAGTAYVVYDDAGSLGSAAVRQLTAQGFTQAFALRGGISAWRADNLPLARA